MLSNVFILAIKYFGLLNKQLLAGIREKLLSDLPDDQVYLDLCRLLSQSGIYNTLKIREAVYKAKSLAEELSVQNINIITLRDKDYPLRFRQLTNPPILLFVKGNVSALNSEKTFGIIGSRNAPDSIFNKGVEFSTRLTGKGYMIVSGLAKGCDTSAHIGCLEVNGITTAILPCSLDKIYPAENRLLAERIVDNKGCLVSEYATGKGMQIYHFLQRNRLQAALSDKLLVLQSGVTGGTIHTVRYALQFNKGIYCYMPIRIPNNVDMSGNELLLKGMIPKLKSGRWFNKYETFHNEIIRVPSPKRI